ncbi:MAG: protease pro-enzyme activation domain-containing protein, partial [Thermoplasmata archaeon]
LLTAPTAVVPDSEPGLALSGSLDVGPAPATPETVLVTLAYSNQGQLDQFLQAVQDPSSPLYHHYLTASEFDSEYGGSPAVYSSAVSYFGSFGVTHLTTYPTGATITFDATPTQVASIFHTSERSFTDARGRPYYAAVGAPRLPTPLVPYVLGVEGLSDYSVYTNTFDAKLALPHLEGQFGHMTQGSAHLVPSTGSSGRSLPPSYCGSSCYGTPCTASNPFTCTDAGIGPEGSQLGYDEPIDHGQFLPMATEQVSYNETGEGTDPANGASYSPLFEQYGYPIGADIATILWSDPVCDSDPTCLSTMGSPGGSYCDSLSSSDFASDIYLPDVLDTWNYTLPAGEPHPNAYPALTTAGSNYSAVVTAKGGLSASCDSRGADLENELDLDAEGSLAPGANIFQVFSPGGGNNAELDTDFADILSPSTSVFPASWTNGTYGDQSEILAGLQNVSVIANSYGTPGDYNTTDPSWESDLTAAAARGITVTVGTGDSGDNEVATPSTYGTSSTGDLATGGTTLVVNATSLLREVPALATRGSTCGATSVPKSPGVGCGEIVWYDGTYGGGTVSGVVPASDQARPAYQNGSSDANTILNTINTGRGVADVSAIANDSWLDFTQGNYGVNVTCGVVPADCTQVDPTGPNSDPGVAHVGFSDEGGTSLSSQVVGGEIATIDHALWSNDQAHHLSDGLACGTTGSCSAWVGFDNPQVYKWGQQEYQHQLSLLAFYTITTFHNSEPQGSLCGGSGSTDYGACPGYSPDAGWGVIDAGNYTQNAALYNVSFTEAGLAPGANWSVTLTPQVGDGACTAPPSTSSPIGTACPGNAQTITSSVTATSGSVITFFEAYGTYAFTVAPVDGHAGPSPASGSERVNGADVDRLISLVSPKLTLKSLQGPVGSPYQVKGAGFTISSGATVTFKAFLQTPNACSQGTFNGSTITTNGTGGFLCTFPVPSESAGSYRVVAEDLETFAQSPPRTFQVTVPKITLVPGQGPAGGRYIVTGAGFDPASEATVSFNGTLQTPTACSIGTFSGATITTASGSGAFRCTFTVPSETKGHYSVVGKDLATSTLTATRSFKVTVPTITLTPNHGTPSGSFTVTGTGFSVSSSATVSFNGVLQTPISCSNGTFGGTSITTTGGGAFVCTFTVPSLSAGHYPVVGTDTATGLASTKSFSVT